MSNSAIGLLVLVAAMAAVVAVLVLRARGAAARDTHESRGGPASVTPPNSVIPKPYNPEKIGNDASARPWERSSMAFQAGKYGGTGGIRPRSTSGSMSTAVPAGFDAEGFVEAAKREFVALQGAWDRCDTQLLRSMMTEAMKAQIGRQLAEREAAGAISPNRTDIVMLEAKLLGVEDRGGVLLASVEFSGMLREDPSAGPSPFREVWNMERPKAGPGASGSWLVAGVQALQ